MRLIANLLFSTRETRDDSIILLKYSREITVKPGLYTQKQYHLVVSKINTFSNLQRMRKSLLK